MLPEVLQHLAVAPDKTYVDATFGAGGYSRAILQAADCKLIGMDRDPRAEGLAQQMVQIFGDRFSFVPACFSALDQHIVTPVDGVVFDIGVSSMQLDDPARGFSFQKDGPLDMRMSQSGPSAADLVNTLEEFDLADLIWRYGEERASRRIAAAIVRRRDEAPFARTLDLADVVKGAVGHGGKTHPATRTFQALRIAVNDELGELRQGLEAAEAILKPGGRLVVVTFHSLEDRLVKRFMAARGGKRRGVSRHQPLPEDRLPDPSFEVITRRTVLPTDAELAVNPRARSAKLRAAARTEAPAWARMTEGV